jgi:uncharacterized membrane protein YcaP (DUF421 family)
METQELLLTALRAAAVYVLMLVVIRLMGKRTVGNFTAFDLLVALMLGEIVDEIIYSDVTFAQGTVAILTIALAKYGTAWLTYWDHGFDALLEGKPTVVVQDGKLQRRGMRKEQMNEKEVLAHLRLQGIDDLREVKLAIVEDDGEISVIKQDWAENLQRADPGGEYARRKKEETSGEEEPPPSKQTTSKKALDQEG